MSLMIFSASLERGVIVHLKGTGWLEYQCQSSLLARAHSKAYQIIPESTSPGTSMVLPLASSGLPILKVAKTDPTVNHIDLRASDSPGLVVRKHMSKKKRSNKGGIHTRRDVQSRILGRVPGQICRSSRPL